MQLISFLFAILIPQIALAYIGPGLSLGAMALVVGVLLSIVIAFVSLVYYPLKRRLKKRKQKATQP